MTEPARPSADELWALRELGLAVDEVLEHALKAREGMDDLMVRLAPLVLKKSGASGLVIRTLNESLQEQSWAFGDWTELDPNALMSRRTTGVSPCPGGTLAVHVLDVVGTSVGVMGLFFRADLTDPSAAARTARVLETVAEALDTVIESLHVAAEKQQIALHVSALLANPVFEQGMDRAVRFLAARLKLPGFMLVWKDAVEENQIHYRGYLAGELEYDGGERPFPPLEEAIAREHDRLVARGNDGLRRVLQPHRTLEAVLVSGVGHDAPLGKILVWSETASFSTFLMDVLHLLASTLSQRLIDYNRERIHLSQFFSCAVIDELVRDPTYEQRYLTPRDEEVGILFADINAFTRICERVLETPARIGRFVDRWSDGVVGLLWKHGGVFDKMVGDCVIGLFGPPLFRSSRLARAEAALAAAMDIQAFTAGMSADPDLKKLGETAELPGLGVAIGLNMARTFCGMFGPNHSYTGFSTGMNQTARLQSLGTFRQILVMAPFRDVLTESSAPFVRGVTYGPLEETPVKNVAQPLKYYRVEGIAVRP